MQLRHVRWLPACIQHLRQAMHDVVRREQILETFERDRAPAVLRYGRARAAHAARIVPFLLYGQLPLQADLEAPGSAHTIRVLLVVAETLLRVETKIGERDLTRIADGGGLLTVPLNVE